MNKQAGIRDDGGVLKACATAHGEWQEAIDAADANFDAASAIHNTFYGADYAKRGWAYQEKHDTAYDAACDAREAAYFAADDAYEAARERAEAIYRDTVKEES